MRDGGGGGWGGECRGGGHDAAERGRDRLPCAQMGKSGEAPRVSDQVAWLRAGHASNLLNFVKTKPPSSFEARLEAH